MTGCNGEALLAALKAAAGSTGPQLVLPVEGLRETWLRPVAALRGRQCPEDVRCLTEWRNRHVKAFLARFTATEARTSAWLANVVLPDRGRVLFMLESKDRGRIGCLGLAFIDWSRSCGEADAVLRGRPAARGTMFLALTTLLCWARDTLGLARLGVRVLSHNPALAFYRAVGFEEIRRVPMRCCSGEGEDTWVAAHGSADADLWLVHHEWRGPDSGTASSPDSIRQEADAEHC